MKKMKLNFSNIIILFCFGCITEPNEVYGCLDSQACNYNLEATIDNNSCLYEVDCMGDCGGEHIEDNCGICNGDNSTCIVTDYDGNIYQTVIIGDQEWMSENLKTTHYQNGDAIPNITNNEDWINLSTGAYGYYNDDLSHQETYGNLYNWYTVDDSRGVCPDSWHVPSDEEYAVLTDFLGGYTVAGGKMKEVGYDHWNSPNTGATNESGFNGYPSGYRGDYGGNYYYMGNLGNFWSSTEGNSSDAWKLLLYYNSLAVNRYPSSKQFGFSVRCVRPVE